MRDQITLLKRVPKKYLLCGVQNPPRYDDGTEIIQWLKTKYCGNKPKGGLWTSTHTPEDEYACDWMRGLSTNALIRLARPKSEVQRAFLLSCAPDARILHVSSVEEAAAFTAQYSSGKCPLPDMLRSGIGSAITDEITDWCRAFKEYDAVHLTASAADQVMLAKMSGHTTAFDTWNCESTLWAKWCFTSVADYKR